jgi:hypothetical protein
MDAQLVEEEQEMEIAGEYALVDAKPLVLLTETTV